MASNINEEYYAEINKILNEPKKTLDQNNLSNKIEYSITQRRLIEIEKSPIKGKYDFDHLASIHKKIFEGLYDWAGKQRILNISKGIISPDGKREVGHFLPSNEIHFALIDFKENLANDNYLKNLSKDVFTEQFTKYYARINEIHPFNEGNGRATKEMMRSLALDAGYTVQYNKIDPFEWNYASKRSLTDQAYFYGSDRITMHQDLSYLKNVMDKIIEPLEKDKYSELSEKQKIAIESIKAVIRENFHDRPDLLKYKLDELDNKIQDVVSGKITLPDTPVLKIQANIEVSTAEKQDKDKER